MHKTGPEACAALRASSARRYGITGGARAPKPYAQQNYPHTRNKAGAPSHNPLHQPSSDQSRRVVSGRMLATGVVERHGKDVASGGA